MKANDGQCLTLVSLSASNCSAVVLTGQDVGPSQVPPQQCWYSFAAGYAEANRGYMKLRKFQKRTMSSVGIKPTTLES